MATTYLTLTNRVLRELNETELTSSTFSSSRGIQTAVKDFINKGIHDVYNEASEVPLLYSRTTQNLISGDSEYNFPTDFRKVDRDSFTIGPRELVTNGEFESNIDSWTTISGSGSGAYTSTGNGRLRLNDFAAHQTISTTINKQYKLQVKVYDTNSIGAALKVQVGTAAEGTQNLNTTLTVTDFGKGAILDATFTATSQSTFITVNNTVTTTNLDVDYIRCSRSDTPRHKVNYISYDDYLQNYKSIDDRNDSDVQGTPSKVYILPNFTAFGVTPIPSDDELTLSYNYYTTHTDLSAHGDNMSLPDRFSSLIIDRAKYYVYMLRSDPQHAQLADRDYQRKLRLFKTDYSTKADYMRSDVRVYNVMSDR